MFAYTLVWDRVWIAIFGMSVRYLVARAIARCRASEVNFDLNHEVHLWIHFCIVACFHIYANASIENSFCIICLGIVPAMLCGFCRSRRGARFYKRTQLRLGRVVCLEYNCCKVCHPTCRLNDRASMERARVRLTARCIFSYFVFDVFYLVSLFIG